MWLPKWTRPVGVPNSAMQEAPASHRDRLAIYLALLTIVCVVSIFVLSRSTDFLMPGPLSSAHATIKECGVCHTKSGTGKVSWLRGFVAGDKLADSKACLTCHEMPDTAFNAHSFGSQALTQITERLSKVGVATKAPRSAHAQTFAFPTDAVIAQGLRCSTCHQEHQGLAFDLKKASDARCSSCHVVKFDSFEGRHPEFEGYPFKRRTRIIFDHVGHFGKHFPEIAKKDPAKRIPATCSTCHDLGKDKQIMSVVPFEKTCASCHLDQIIGKARLSGPKGIAFLALPGLDVQTLKQRKADVGEWPAASEAALTPFMKLIIGRHQHGRALIDVIEKLDLQDLRKAPNDQIIAVTKLVWEIKKLFHTLITGKASDALMGVEMGDRESPGAINAAALMASIPLDVVSIAQQQWLPNLEVEMANRPIATGSSQGGWATAVVGLKEAGPSDTVGKAEWRTAAKERDSAPLADKFPAKTSAARSAGGSAVNAPAASTNAVKETPASGVAPSAKATDQIDDLLVLTEAELRAIKARGKNAGKPETAAAGSVRSATSAVAEVRAGSAVAATNPIANTTEARSATAISTAIKSNVDPESWAEHGGWYRQEFAIFYRPTGHKDAFIAAWLRLTGPQAQKDSKSPVSATFDALAGKDAQGSCTKCHSVDVGQNGQVVNFSPSSIKNRAGRFTSFDHRPHMSIVGPRGCLTCHSLEQGRSYLESYEQGNPQRHTSNFGAVKKDGCQTCHTSGRARQDCLTCHTYHVNGVISPITKTPIPEQ